MLAASTTQQSTSTKQQGAISTMKRLTGVSTLVTALLLAGCTTPLPKQLPDISGVSQDARKQVTQDWNVVPALTKRTLNRVSLRVGSLPLPTAVANKAVNIRLPHGATVSDLAAVLNAVGIPSIVASSELGDKPIGLSIFKGTLNDLLRGLSATRQINFAWRRGMVAFSNNIPMIAYLPQNDDLIKLVQSDLKGMGATHVTTSKVAGTVSFDAPSNRQWQIEHYIHHLASNAATLSLQVAIVKVNLSKDRNTGLDWSRLQLTLGHGLDFGAVTDAGGSSSDTGGGAGTNATGNTTPTNGVVDSIKDASKIGATVTGSALGILGKAGDFNLTSMFSLLSTYGNTQTTQNLILRTLSGQEVKIRSGETVPYISGVSVNSTNDGGLMGGTETDTVKTGLTLEIKPNYSASSQLVTLDVALKMKSIVAFLKLAAGDQIGTLSRPDVQDQSLETVARVSAGQTVVLGGLIYNEISDDRNTLAGLESWSVAHHAKKVKKNALFIVIRPTVTQYVFSDSQRP